MKQQGQICPLSGAPLAETDLTPLEPLRLRISKWILQRSMEAGASSTSSDSVSTDPSMVASPKGAAFPKQSSPQIKSAAANRSNASNTDDDLYDF